MISCSLIKHIFRGGCLILTCVLVVQWINRYLLDEDTTVIETTSYFHTEDDIFPVLTACFEQSFEDKVFEKLGYKVKGSDYKSFLSGDNSTQNMTQVDYGKMTQIDYDSVTTNISDYIISYGVLFKNRTRVCDTRSHLAWKPPYETHSWNSWGSFVKCFSFEITNRNVYNLNIYMLRDIFPDGIRPHAGGFVVLFHYPNQILSSIHSMTRNWGIRNEETDYWIDLDIKGMDVVVHRYKRNVENCIQNWQNYDNIALEKLIKAVGCKAPYHKTKQKWPICDSSDKMKKVINHELRNYGMVPCREIGNIHYQVSDANYDRSVPLSELQGKPRERWFSIGWTFLNFNFVKTISKKEVDLQSLIGWIGGYIGIFTGFALTQIPEILCRCVLFLTSMRKPFRYGDSNDVKMSN